jgi:hypothetical protein
MERGDGEDVLGRRMERGKTEMGKRKKRNWGKTRVKV